MGTMPRPFILFTLFSLLFSTATSATAPSPTAAAVAAPTASPTPVSRSPATSHSTLDPKQIRALQSLNIPTSKDPCSNPTTSSCDDESPFRHLLSLRLVNCSDDVEMSATALKSLSSLTNLELINCPVAPVRFPSELALNLRTFTCINSFRHLTGVWLSRLQNVTDLTVSDVTVNASGPSIILGNMKKIQSLTISQANLAGFLPKHWHLNITHIDLSGNKLRGKIPSSLTTLENLQIINLSSNQLQGEIPDSIGDLMSLQNISLSSNSLTGPVPELMAAIPTLVHLDLGSNQLNGTIPKFIADMKALKYLNLEQNNFNGIMPFNASFIKRLEVFKIGGNSNLCYNQTTMPGKVKLGIAPCNKRGLPMSPPPAKDSSADDSSPKDDDYNDSDSDSKVENHHGPSKVVLGVAIGISSIVFLIVFMILLSKWCG